MLHLHSRSHLTKPRGRPSKGSSCMHFLCLFLHVKAAPWECCCLRCLNYEAAKPLCPIICALCSSRLHLPRGSGNAGIHPGEHRLYGQNHGEIGPRRRPQRLPSRWCVLHARSCALMHMHESTASACVCWPGARIRAYTCQYLGVALVSAWYCVALSTCSSRTQPSPLLQQLWASFYTGRFCSVVLRISAAAEIASLASM